MTEQSNKQRPYSSPFVSEETPNMAIILERVDDPGNLSPTKRRDLKSAIRSFCRLIGKDPAIVPANINWLHVRIRRVSPAAHHITKKRLANIKSDVLKALELTGCSRQRSDWLRQPSPEWQSLLDKITIKQDRWKLSQFSQYCTALGIAPSEVTDDHMTGFLKALIDETFSDKPDQVGVNAVKAWNQLREQVEGWPDVVLARPPRRKEPWTIPVDRFPDAFQEDVDRWLHRLANPDPFDADSPLKPLRPVTIAHRRHQIEQMASAVVLAGHSIEGIRSLASLVDLGNFKDGLRQLMSRFDDKPTEAIHGLAMGLKAIATHHVKVEEAHLNEIRRICQRLNLNVDGLRQKNMVRLLQLDDPYNMAKLLHLPEKLVRLSARSGLRPHKAALLMQAALAIEILLYAPMRAKTLVQLHLEHNIRFVGTGRRQRTLITVPGHKVKNNRDLHYELGESATALLERYLKEARPILLREPSDYLFPAQNGGPKRTEYVSGLIKMTILEHTGLTINAHLFRSIAGKIHSMAAPGDFTTLSHVLHNTLRTAMKSYAQFEHQSSLRHYQDSVDMARKNILARTRKKKPKS
jgi:integrase